MPGPDRIALALLPTPLERAVPLSEAWGGPDIWVKRDDLTGFELSGNKVRKLEYHLGTALGRGASTVVTCGALQSNHCRATALASARLGLRCVLYLRTHDGMLPGSLAGNHLLQRLAGAECRFITPDDYTRRDEIMAAAAEELGDAWVIPEGASDALGAMGYVDAAGELAAQVEGLETGFTIWHAASSAGTTAGLVMGASSAGLDVAIVACSVGEPAADLTTHVEEIIGEEEAAVPWSVVDRYVGGGYGIASTAELAVQAEASRLTGMVFDPTYTGKALYGLHREIAAGSFTPGDTVLFWHTGGGFAAFAHDWSTAVRSP